MAENTNDSQVVETEEELTNYTTETNAGAGTGTSTIAPGYGTGRRKEAVARVRAVVRALDPAGVGGPGVAVAVTEGGGLGVGRRSGKHEPNEECEVRFHACLSVL